MGAVSLSLFLLSTLRGASASSTHRAPIFPPPVALVVDLMRTSGTSTALLLVWTGLQWSVASLLVVWARFLVPSAIVWLPFALALSHRKQVVSNGRARNNRGQSS